MIAVIVVAKSRTITSKNTDSFQISIKDPYELKLFLGLAKRRLKDRYSPWQFQDWNIDVRIRLYSCKFQTVFTPSCFPGKHLLSYYHEDANVADVWGSIYMTIPSAPERLYGFVVTAFPTGTLVPFPKCFQLHRLTMTFSTAFQICLMKLTLNHCHAFAAYVSSTQ